MRQFRILFTADLHARLFARAGVCGLDETSRLFSKDENTLLLDGGDLFQGGADGTFLAACDETPHPVVKLMDRCGYDAGTIGNHDFNYGVDYFARCLDGRRMRCLCANIRDKARRLPIEESHIFTLGNGLRIGVVGICTDILASWERKETVAELTILPVLESAGRALDAIRGDCDVTVGLYHGGFEEDLSTGALLDPSGENLACRICRTLDFDLLLTAHQHVLQEGATISGTFAVQTGCFGKQYAEIVGTVPDEGRAAFTAKLLPAPVPQQDPADSPTLAAMRRWEGEVLCTLPQALPVGDRVEIALHGSPLAQLVDRVMLDVTGAEIAATCISASSAGLPQRVTVGDVFRMYTSANTICTVRCTGAILRSALERTALFLTWEDGAYRIDRQFLVPKERLYHCDFYAGIDYEIDFRRPQGQRLVRLQYHGREVQDGDRFVLAITSYRYAGGDGYDMFRGCELIDADPTPIAEHIVRYLREHGE